MRERERKKKVASTFYFVSFLTLACQIVSGTLTNTDLCHFSFTRLWSAALSQNSLLGNIKFETPQVGLNVVEIEKKKKKSFLFFPFLYSYICMRSMLYVSAGSVYAGLIYAKACGYEKIWRYMDMNYKVYEKVNVFNCIRLWDTSL